MRTLDSLTPIFQYGLDLLSGIRFGLSAPRKYELIWVDPLCIRLRVKHRTSFTGMHPTTYKRAVIGGDWDKQVQYFSEDEMRVVERLKLQGLQERILKGSPWFETETYKERFETLMTRGSVDGIQTIKSLESRFTILDQMIDGVRERGRLKTRKELNSAAFREKGGVPLMIDRHGQYILGRGGTHRFLISQILKAKIMPTALVGIHPQACKRLALIRRTSESLIRSFMNH